MSYDTSHLLTVGSAKAIYDTVAKNIMAGAHYIMSPAVVGYLDTSGELAENAKRVTFTKYIMAETNLRVVFDGLYNGTVCIYNGSTKALEDRITAGYKYGVSVPKGKYFRVTIFKMAAENVTDVNDYIYHAKIYEQYQVRHITDRQDLDDIVDPGLYYSPTNSGNTVAAHAPVAHDRAAPLYFSMLVGGYEAADGWKIQLLTDYQNNVFVRRKSATSGWSDWSELTKYSDFDAAKNRAMPNAAKIFHRVGCIGDSYTEGFINVNDGVSSGPYKEYSWPHHMTRLTGHEWTNFAKGGSSCKSWIDDADGGTYSHLDLVQAEGNKCQAYVIGLGINDSNPDSHAYVALGTEADIGATPGEGSGEVNTFYAYYYALIAAVHEVNEDAPIFCNTCPRTESRFTSYNKAIRDIVDYCQEHSLPVYLCDLAGTAYNTPMLYKNPVFTDDYIMGHYSSIGYEMMAECYMRVLSDVILNNLSDFQKVHLIDYDEPT